MESFNDRIKPGLQSGAIKGLGAFWWLLKILIPISFLTFILAYSGWINRIDFLLKPVLELISLPPMAALPLIAGLSTGIYGAIASMAVLPLTTDQMTLIAIFVLISHNLIQETVIQAKSGIHPIKAVLFRLGTSIITVMIVALFLNTKPQVSETAYRLTENRESFLTALKIWSLQTLY